MIEVSSDTETDNTVDEIKPPDPKEAPIKRDYWDDTGQVFFTGGNGWAVAPALHRFILGSETTVLEVLRTGKMPDDATPLQRAEYERISELQKGGKNAQSTFKVRPGSAIRSRPTRATKHRATSSKRTSAGKRFPRNKTKR
ncbi:hypothetical protein ACFLXU_06455 [Chloroflexota bacterium]